MPAVLPSHHAGAGCTSAPSDSRRLRPPTARTGLPIGGSSLRNRRSPMSRLDDPSKSGKGGTMGVLGRLEHLSNLAHAVERRGRSDDLVQEIAEALVASGEYVTRMDVLRAQQAVDFNWAAHQ